MNYTINSCEGKHLLILNLKCLNVLNSCASAPTNLIPALR